jgi:hypothetical protein
MELPESKTLPLEEIKPYWRNPRRIPPQAITAVRESIERYGYVQPIIVDRENVVVVGHTRLEALKQLGVSEIEVYVTDLPEDKAKEYRLVDNRTNELSTWDHSYLVLELREFEQDLLTNFFPDVDLEIGLLHSAITEQDIEDAGNKIRHVTEAAGTATHTTEVVCPSCFHSFSVRTRSLPGLTYEDLDNLAAS